MRARPGNPYARITAGLGMDARASGRGPAGLVRCPQIRRRYRCTEAGRAKSCLDCTRRAFGSAIAFFDPAQQDKARAVAQRARVKQAQGLPLTEQEKRLSHYRKTAAEVRADWLEDPGRRVGTIDGVEFYEMNRSNPEKYDFAARDRPRVWLACAKGSLSPGLATASRQPSRLGQTAQRWTSSLPLVRS